MSIWFKTVCLEVILLRDINLVVFNKNFTIYYVMIKFSNPFTYPNPHLFMDCIDSQQVWTQHPSPQNGQIKLQTFPRKRRQLRQLWVNKVDLCLQLKIEDKMLSVFSFRRLISVTSQMISKDQSDACQFNCLS